MSLLRRELNNIAVHDDRITKVVRRTRKDEQLRKITGREGQKLTETGYQWFGGGSAMLHGDFNYNEVREKRHPRKENYLVQ